MHIPMKLSLARPIIFFDLETTGTDAARDRIVEIACVKLLPDGRRDTWVERINPGRPIPAGATAIHGISDADVAGKPYFEELAEDLHFWMCNCDLGGYNSGRFDLPMLVEEFLRAGIECDFSDCRMVDVQQIFFKMEQRTLSAAYRFYCKKEIENAHSAEADICATIEILEAQLDHYSEQLASGVDDLHEFCTGGEQHLDYARRLQVVDGHPCFTFGKHKGKRVAEVFHHEPGYFNWMMDADFPLHTKKKLREIYDNLKPVVKKAGEAIIA